MFSGFATIDCAYIYAREGLEETNASFFGNEWVFVSETKFFLETNLNNVNNLVHEYE